MSRVAIPTYILYVIHALIHSRLYWVCGRIALSWPSYYTSCVATTNLFRRLARFSILAIATPALQPSNFRFPGKFNCQTRPGYSYYHYRYMDYARDKVQQDVEGFHFK